MPPNGPFQILEVVNGGLETDFGPGDTDQRRPPGLAQLEGALNIAMVEDRLDHCPLGVVSGDDPIQLLVGYLRERIRLVVSFNLEILLQSNLAWVSEITLFVLQACQG